MITTEQMKAAYLNQIPVHVRYKSYNHNIDGEYVPCGIHYSVYRREDGTQKFSNSITIKIHNIDYTLDCKYVYMSGDLEVQENEC